MARDKLSKIAVLLLFVASAACGGEEPRESGTPSPTVQKASPTADQTAGAEAAPTPSCSPGEKATTASTEGPYFKSGSPERASLVEPGMNGTKLVLTGFVLTTDCRPVARAKLDFWQANAEGDYDNNGYRLRGHQFTNDQGAYRLDTIVPGKYPGRTPHIHFKVQPPNGNVLTSQLYTPDEPDNASDNIFRPELVMKVTSAGNGKAARFDFIVP
jgi:protocatechuate 3,4-dioxygenase beta subunit